jgi:hypothetical protein
MDTETATTPSSTRLRVDLPAAAADALREAAVRDRRTMPDQAAWLLMQTLRRRGYFREHDMAGEAER